MSTRPQNQHTHQQAGRGKASHHHHLASANRDRDASTKQGLQLLATSSEELRHYILTTGLQSTSNGINDMRPFIWSIFLNVSPHSPAKYISHLSHGPSPLAHKIRNDTPRTLATDPLFRKRVTEGMLRRILNAFDWSMSKRNKGIRYVQGMNVLAAPFLYVCGGEAECMAFGLFEKFITIECPVYVRPTLEGVHRGLKLLDICLHRIEPKLYNYLRQKKLQAELYAFPSVLTFSACTPPLSEVLLLWDFLLAYGVHMNILAIISQIIILRDDILQHASPMKLLRKLPPLNSRKVIALSVSFLRKIPQDVYTLLASHAWDDTVGGRIDQLHANLE